MLTDRLFCPDHRFRDVYEIDPEWLRGLGVRAVLLDIDNTLVTYDDPEPTEEASAWLDKLGRAGVAVAFVSNNDRERVERFNARLGFVAEWKAGKPLVRKSRRALSALGVTPCETAVIGDQIFTDIRSGKKLGVRVTILVEPIKDKLTPFFRFKRLLERPIKYRYEKIREKKHESSQ
ncbi:MAG: YqeG family HAD IIIA-type phosphatase [Clostridia bacterium]|nr:YqeG family HAD IIIA-type phosphatase [Clostridia bacterium]